MSTLAEIFIDPYLYQSYAVARMLYLPSFDREWLVEVWTSRDGYFAVSTVPDSSILYTARDPDGWSPELAKRIPLTRDTAALDAETAELIAEVWHTALLQTRHAPGGGSIFLDGLGVHFSQHWRKGTLSGRTHSPPSDSPASGLINLGVLIGDYARGANATQSDIENAAEDLLRQLQVER